MKILSNLESQNKWLVIFLGCILIGIIGFFDYLTGYEYAFSVFYVLPISLITWVSNQKIGYLASFLSALVWLWADASTGHVYSHPLIPFWNSLIRLGFFIIITFLLFNLRSALQREKELSHTDHLTGASNSRYFHDMVQMEINRLERNQRPFTLAYIDVDNFKTVNDNFGHLEGDLVLQVLVGTIKTKIRNTDLVARLGGDEFALFFPDTNQEAAQIIFPKIHGILLDEMRKNNWAVTFSIGVITCTLAPDSLNALIKTADDLMYSAKRDGKNRVKYSTFRV